MPAAWRTNLAGFCGTRGAETPQDFPLELQFKRIGHENPTTTSCDSRRSAVQSGAKIAYQQIFAKLHEC